MTPTIFIVANALLAAAVVVVLAFVMGRATTLRPHV
jgi:hypothetical protein